MPRTAAIELNDLDAKIVQLNQNKKKGEVQLEIAVRVSFDGLPRGEEGQADRASRLKEALKQNKLKTDEVALVVPKQSATVRKVRLPSDDPGELASMVAFEAEKIIPFNVERHIIDHAILTRDGIEGSYVMIAAVDDPVMQQWYNTAKGAGVEPMNAVVSSLALGYGILHRLDEKERKRSFAVLQIGTVYTDISLFSEGSLITTRSVMHGVRNLLSDVHAGNGDGNLPEIQEIANIDALHPENSVMLRAASVERKQPAVAGSDEDSPGFEVLHDEAPDQSSAHQAAAIRKWVAKNVTNLQRTYEFALREYNLKPLEKLYLAGEGALTGNIAEALKEQFGVAVEIYNPLETISRAPKSSVNNKLLPAFATAFGAALELAEEGADGTINLLPHAVMETRRKSELRLHYLATATMALICGVIIYMYVDMRRDIQTEQLDRYTSYTEDLDGVISDVAEMEERMEIIRDVRSERAGALQILDALSSYEPMGSSIAGGRVSLETFDFMINDEVRVSGQALESEDLNRFLQFLREMTDKDGNYIFSNVDITSQEPKPLSGRDKTVYQFDITGILKSRDS